jgi:hypothetical protein
MLRDACASAQVTRPPCPSHWAGWNAHMAKDIERWMNAPSDTASAVLASSVKQEQEGLGGDSGKVKRSLYEGGSRMNPATVMCRSCGGRGIVIA